MFDDDSLEKLGSDAAVPHAFRIHDNDRASAAYAKAWSLAALYACGSEQQILAFEKGDKLRIQSPSAPVGRAKIAGANNDVTRVRLHPRSRKVDWLARHLIVGDGVGGLVVARGRDIQVVSNDIAIDEMLGNDSLGTNQIDRCVPYIIWIDDDHWTVPALILAAGVVHSNDVANARGGDGFFKSSMNFNGSRKRTGFAAGAHEDVMTVLAHSLTYPVTGTW